MQAAFCALLLIDELGHLPFSAGLVFSRFAHGAEVGKHSAEEKTLRSIVLLKLSTPCLLLSKELRNA